MLFLYYHLASRLAYVLYVALALTRQRHQGLAGGFPRFRRTASLVMNNDGLSFVLLCIATRGAIPPSVGWGIVLVCLGVGTKLWARATLGKDAYYWRDFFTREQPALSGRGPYRWLRNPMYTVGYLQTYGLALLFGSRWGLIAGAFDQAAILLFHLLVERPHVYGRNEGATSRSPGM